MIPAPITPAAEQAQHEALAISSAADLIVVNSQPSYQQAAFTLQAIKAQQKQLESVRTSMTGPLNASLRAINDFFRTPAGKLGDAEKSIKRAMADYSRRVEEERHAAERQAEEARRKAEQEAAAAAKAAAAAAWDGEQERAAALTRESEEKRASAASVAPVAPAAPAAAGVALRRVWKCEIVDADQLPREYLIPDIAGIGHAVRAAKGQIEIRGVRVYSEVSVASGSGRF